MTGVISCEIKVFHCSIIGFPIHVITITFNYHPYVKTNIHSILGGSNPIRASLWITSQYSKILEKIFIIT